MSVFQAFSMQFSTLMINGVKLDGYKEITANVKVEKNNVYASSQEPYSRSRKTKQYEGSINLFFREAANLIKSAPGAMVLTDIPPFNVIYLATTAAGETVRITISDCEFLDHNFKNAADDDDVEMSTGIIFSGYKTEVLY